MKEKKQKVLDVVQVESGETAVVEKNQSVESLISQAISQNLPVETMERLFTLREKVKAEKAREAFTEALSKFQSVCPVIEKTKTVLNKDGKTPRYKFAPLEAIAEQIKTHLVENKLSYKWKVENSTGLIKAICVVTHVLGHSEESSFEVPIDKDSYMSAPQQYASALTFAKRYSLINALGISTGDEDTDANTVNKEKGAQSDKSKIIFLLRNLGYETTDKVVISETVQKLAKLELEDKNYREIVSRLELLVKEKREYESSQV